MMPLFDIIITLNHRTAGDILLKRLVERGATILRLNGAFLDPSSLGMEVARIRNLVGEKVRIMVDLPGYKLRLSNLDGSISVPAGTDIELHRDRFNYPEFFDLINNGVAFHVNDGLDRLVVVEKRRDSLVCRSERDCTLKRGKGVHLEGVSYRPSTNSLSQRDRDLIEASREADVNLLGLSFVYNVEDILYVEKMIEGSRLACIPKIESKESLNSLYDIMKNHKTVIVDRGDLSGEIGIQNIWRATRMILSTANLLKTRVIVATQFLLHMIDKPLPSIAEVDSMYDLMMLGIAGVQLSEETSVGHHALEAVSFVSEMARKVREESSVILHA